MNVRLTNLLFALATLSATGSAAAQGLPFLFSTKSTETTLSGSGGTVLQTLRPNEIAMVEFSPCPVISAEKWSPRTCFHTMAGDENSNGMYWNPTLFGEIDALLEMPSPIAASNQRDVFWSPAQPMGTGVSALPLRPGDVGRIVRTSAGDGQVEYFIRAEQIQQALGMPISPIVVDVDAIAADPSYGVFFSLDGNHPCAGSCGLVFAQDGAVLHIPAAAITWTWDLRVQAVVPGSAVQVYSEFQMDLMVQNAQVTNRNGVCVNAIQDLEALDIDYTGPVIGIPGCTGTPIIVPTLIFSGELLTGASLLTTDLGGSILNRGCGPIGRGCGGGPTFGFEMGLQPPSTTQGVLSYVNALTTSFPHLFVIEPKQHVIPAWTPVVMDLNSPAAPTWLFAKFAPTGINAVAPSLPFPNVLFPDLYITPVAWFGITGPGFTTLATPPIPGTCKLVFQAATIWNSQVVLSTPAMVDVL